MEANGSGCKIIPQEFYPLKSALNFAVSIEVAYDRMNFMKKPTRSISLSPILLIQRLVTSLIVVDSEVSLCLETFRG